ncbi:FadR family transcriptional regulator [Thalassospira xiamenensis]|nr:FadR family transcriptional regulator [Pseudidiomarina aestuarii]PTC01592.1 FadR family transcriptional regulator [Thalassospira xiamenensis]
MTGTSADNIAVELRSRIDDGRWPDGTRIPPERDLAKEFDVARNTVRRACDLLQQENLLARYVGRGTYVTAKAKSGSLSYIAARMEGASPADMMEIRLLLEPEAAAFAATNATSTELANIEAAHLNAVAATDMPTFEKWDTEFHKLVFDCSRNELLREINNILTFLRNQGPWFEMKKRSFSNERRLHYCEEHARIVEALNHRLPNEARDAMHAHLITVEKNMLGR